MPLILDTPWRRGETLLTELEKIAVVVVYANPNKSLKEVAAAVGMLPEKIKRLRNLNAGQAVHEIAVSNGSPEALTEYHISDQYPVPKAILDERARPPNPEPEFKPVWNVLESTPFILPWDVDFED